jgi:kynurenine formamidase
MSATRLANATDFEQLCQRVSNWGRWGKDDELGTLNFITADRIAAAARLVRRGAAFSLAVPYDEKGPQSGAIRINPIHTMLKSGADIAAGTYTRDFLGGKDRDLKATDDMVVMPLQCGTHWDALGHIMHRDRMYNGYPASEVTSRGALRGDIVNAKTGFIGRGVLLDIARHLGHESAPSEPIGARELEGCARSQGVEVSSGDILLVRTGRMGRVKTEGWNGYDSVAAGQSGIGVESVEWLREKEIAGVAVDTLTAEAMPSEIPGVFMPVHLATIVYMGLLLGEIFDLEALADDCAKDGVYEFQLVAAPLPFTGAVGAPLNPIAIK